MATMRAHLDDLTDSGRGEVAELLRPFYLDYLRSTASRRREQRPEIAQRSRRASRGR